jgi:effector-binding domain-containing protein
MTDLVPEQPHDEGARIELAPVPLAVVRHHGVSVADLRDLFDAGYAAIGALIGTGAVAVAGPPLAVYRGDPDDRFDLEIGFPVSTPVDDPIQAGDLQVVGSTLPAGPALAATHLGAYDDLGAAWGRLAQTPGVTPTGPWIEVYVSDPRTDPAPLRTDLLLPIAG